jgi:hypothetical protein
MYSRMVPATSMLARPFINVVVFPQPALGVAPVAAPPPAPAPAMLDVPAMLDMPPTALAPPTLPDPPGFATTGPVPPLLAPAPPLGGEPTMPADEAPAGVPAAPAAPAPPESKPVASPLQDSEQ